MKTVDSNTNPVVTQDFGTFVTATGAAAAAVTLTIPAPAAGLKVFINHVTITRFAAAALTAAAAPLTVTTTNLSGSPIYDFDASAAAKGTIDRLVLAFPNPVSATTAAAAVTFVAPATTDVIWRITANYTTGTN